MISFEEFKKIDLRVAKIIKAEAVKDSKKLLKLQVDLGEEKRQIIAGIQESYSPEELLNREIIIVANLEPRTIFNFESQGMLLAAENGKLALLQPDKEVLPGTKIN
jgi:methionine--tRNA ligase beta chain